jgi:RNA polymerase sigma-70 factor (ECF subfamily)
MAFASGASMDPPFGTDAELLEATSNDDERAFLEIYRRHRDRVYRFAYRMTGSPEAARDVTQTCFASLLEAPRRFDARRASLGTYLCSAARNQSLRHARRTWRERTLDGAPQVTTSRESGPLERLLEDERVRIVREAILALAPLHREVVILAEYEELDLATIATIVGAGTGAVKVRLHRARQKLRQALEGYLGFTASRIAK